MVSIDYKKLLLIIVLWGFVFWGVFAVSGEKIPCVLVEGGNFAMGDWSSSGYDDSLPVHIVSVRSFYMSKYEITYDVFEKYWNEWYNLNDSGFGRGKQPVINISWYDAVRFCNWLSKQEGYKPVYTINDAHVSWNEKANGYRLPTEAEWEFAARGGNQQIKLFYSGSNDLDYVGWYGGDSMGMQGNSDFKPHPVGLKPPNVLELYDMTGNVYEWCWDWYDKEYYTSTTITISPNGPEQGFDKVVRGGCWGNTANYLKVFDRFCYHPATKSMKVGFRVVRNAE